MTPKKWFQRTKTKKEDRKHSIDIEISDQQEPLPTEAPVISKPLEEPAETPIVTYRETLYSYEGGKKPVSSKKQGKPLKRRGWESPCTIERNVDVMKQKRFSEMSHSSGPEIEEKVDKVLAKKKASEHDDR